jgi:hypothetical protein
MAAFAAWYFFNAKFAKGRRKGRKETFERSRRKSFPQITACDVHTTLTEKIHSPMIGPKYGGVGSMDGEDDH